MHDVYSYYVGQKLSWEVNDLRNDLQPLPL